LVSSLVDTDMETTFGMAHSGSDRQTMGQLMDDRPRGRGLSFAIESRPVLAAHLTVQQEPYSDPEARRPAREVV